MDILKKILSPKVFLGIQIVITLVFLYFLFNFSVLPDMYFYGVIAIVVILCLLTFLLQFRAKDVGIRSIVSRILAVVISVGLILVSIEINRGTTFINGFSGMDYETDALSVIVMANSDYKELSDLNGKILAVNEQEDQKNLTDALTDIRGQLTNENTEYKNYKDWNYLSDALYNGDIDAIIANEAYRSMLEENHIDFNIETRVIYQVKIKKETENIANEGAIKDGVFNICITGIDTYNLYLQDQEVM